MSILTGRDTSKMNPLVKAYLFIISVSFAQLLSLTLTGVSVILAFRVSPWFAVASVLCGLWFFGSMIVARMIMGMYPMKGENVRSFARRRAFVMLGNDWFTRALIVFACICGYFAFSNLWWLLGILVAWLVFGFIVVGITENDASAMVNTPHYAYFGFYRGDKKDATAE